jgi:hypothetical protein
VHGINTYPEHTPIRALQIIRAEGVGYSHGMSAGSATCLQAKAISFASRYS